MKRILIVDDKATSRERLRTTLEKQGYAVIEAGDGAAALQKAHADGPHLILLDLQMPILEMDTKFLANCANYAMLPGCRIHRIPD